jgi:DNA-binding MarR family transcriptional regulator
MPTRARPTPPARADIGSGETPDGQLRELDLTALLGYQVAQAAIVTLGIFEATVGRPLNLRTVEYTVLALIRANGAVAPAQLAKALSLSPSYITMALDKLEGMDLIRRETNEQDRRGQRLHATPTGTALALKATRDLLAAEREALRALTPVEQLMLGELLHKLARSRAEAGAPADPPRSSRLALGARN